MSAARPADGEAVTFASASTAVALVSRLVLAPDIPREDILGDSDPAGVLAAMECIASGVLAGLQPGDKGAAVLERIGLGLAEVAAGGRGAAFPPGRDSPYHSRNSAAPGA